MTYAVLSSSRFIHTSVGNCLVALGIAIWQNHTDAKRLANYEYDGHPIEFEMPVPIYPCSRCQTPMWMSVGEFGFGIFRPNVVSGMPPNWTDSRGRPVEKVIEGLTPAESDAFFAMYESGGWCPTCKALIPIGEELDDEQEAD